MIAEESKRAKVLLSCYACEPNQGSEPGVGWNWTRELSKENDLVVVTRANNQGVIEKHLSELSGRDIEFVYYDLPQWLLALKKWGIINTSLYYAIWQRGIKRKMNVRMPEFDIVHHMTFNMFLCPGYWRPKHAKLILGPLGGGSCVSGGYLSLFGGKAWIQCIRKKIVESWQWVPQLKKTFDRAHLILCANEDTFNLLKPNYLNKCRLHLETGFDQDKIRKESSCSKDNSHFVQVGSIEPRKGWKLTLAAVKILMNEHGIGDIHVNFIGAGPEYQAAIDMAEQLGLSENITFHGNKSLRETQEVLSQARALLFPSVRDTSGNVVLEAMSQGVPVICLNHQGVKEMTDNECAIQIKPENISQTVRDMSSAMKKLYNDEIMARKMGDAGIRRIRKCYTWSAKQEFMKNVYESVLDSK